MLSATGLSENTNKPKTSAFLKSPAIMMDSNIAYLHRRLHPVYTDNLAFSQLKAVFSPLFIFAHFIYRFGAAD